MAKPIFIGGTSSHAGKSWMATAICAWLRRRGVSARQFLGWIDLNLMALLSRSILRPLFRAPPPWVPVSQMSRVTHRLRWVDPA